MECNSLNAANKYIIFKLSRFLSLRYNRLCFKNNCLCVLSFVKRDNHKYEQNIGRN